MALPLTYDDSLSYYELLNKVVTYLNNTIDPINVGNVNRVTLDGLKNGKIYYFAVATYSKLDDRIIGVLSKEVYARPLRKGTAY